MIEAQQSFDSFEIVRDVIELFPQHKEALFQATSTSTSTATTTNRFTNRRSSRGSGSGGAAAGFRQLGDDDDKAAYQPGHIVITN